MYDFKGIRNFHFIGIGGVGMSALAGILLRAGLTVSGSDLEKNRIVESLERLGARIRTGHQVENVQEAQVAVYSSAISPDNPELREAARRRISAIHRSQLLAELMSHQEGITVTGTHGKTTTASMTTVILERAGLDPSAAIGAVVRDLGSNFLCGSGRHFVAEADESDRTLLRLRPVHTILTNLDNDHLDQYESLADLEETLLRHVEEIPFYGTIIGCADDPPLADALRKVHRPVITYGLKDTADIRADRVELKAFQARYTLLRKGEELGEIRLGLTGRHNVSNSLGAAACALTLGLPFDAIREALGAFQGPRRRLEFKGEREGILVLDDYAHHPVEIDTALQACQSLERRIVVLFQPHRYSRTALLMDQFVRCFGRADELVLMDIYGAGEEPLKGIDSEVMSRQISEFRQVTYLQEREEILAHLENTLRSGDLLVTMGAGDVWRVGEDYLAG